RNRTLSIIHLMTRRTWLTILFVVPLCEGAESGKLPVRVTWGHSRSASANYIVKVEADRGMTVGSIRRAANGLEFVLDCRPRTEPKLQNLHIIWADVLAAADADTARRLGNDAAMDPQSPRLYIRIDEEGTRGFAVTVEQLKRERAIWVPSYDIFI